MVKSSGRLKARLLILGWRQSHGIDCGNTFAPVCRFDNQRLLVGIAGERGWKGMSLGARTTLHPRA